MKSRSDWGLKKVTLKPHIEEAQEGGMETGCRTGQAKGYGVWKQAVAMEMDKEGQRRERAGGQMVPANAVLGKMGGRSTFLGTDWRWQVTQKGEEALGGGNMVFVGLVVYPGDAVRR